MDQGAVPAGSPLRLSLSLLECAALTPAEGDPESRCGAQMFIVFKALFKTLRGDISLRGINDAS
ncbi:MAG: hypothetical protein CMP84_05995 [Gammaproteobacteria bacterium]|jgi:hypothetical protein|nr:hypothetical protein [Gammaproteobacteria bacterium]